MGNIDEVGMGLLALERAVHIKTPRRIFISNDFQAGLFRIQSATNAETSPSNVPTLVLSLVTSSIVNWITSSFS